MKSISMVESVAEKFAVANVSCVDTKCSVKIPVLGKGILIHSTPLAIEDDERDVEANYNTGNSSARGSR